MHIRSALAAFSGWADSGRRLVRRRLGRPRALDVLTALSCLAVMALDVPGLADADNSLDSRLEAGLVLTVSSATLLVRRRAPLLAYGVGLVLLGWLHELTLVQFALYSLARFRGRRAGVVAGVAYVLVAYALFNLPGWPVSRAGTPAEFLSLVVPIGALAVGVGIAANRQDLVRALERQRATTAVLEAVQAERARVSGDVHDFVGRELTLLTVRAEVLARRARGEPYEKDFEELSETARRAHRVLNEIIVQRGSDGAPTPGLDGLAALAEESARAGSEVGLDVDDAALRLSPLRQAAVYRVVQECLTNAAKHAPGRPVAVRIAVADGLARLTVTNALPASAPARTPVSAGTGTAGMAERVRSVGGTFEAGRRNGTYVVSAELDAGSGV
ncbi:sensor histidine kinase [Streptomyces sp. Da 82-17]|uniref:sensor histidine kinase n=1 Tax=Streptomyces sp. Da 82-17 TaxID=3377116 RepID=UPI0038D51720